MLAPLCPSPRRGQTPRSSFGRLDPLCLGFLERNQNQVTKRPDASNTRCRTRRSPDPSENVDESCPPAARQMQPL